MEDFNKKESPVTESQVLNVSTPQEKKVHSRGPQKSKRKWIILAIIVVFAVAPALYILLRPSGEDKVKKNYEECVRECVLLKNSDEIDVPYGNCFEYCREDASSP
jgi:hypothetical protein